MTDNNYNETDKNQLLTYLETWYSWLYSNAESLFTKHDSDRMRNPVIFFQQSNDWQTRTTSKNTEWFFNEGSRLLMNKWLKENDHAEME